MCGFFGIISSYVDQNLIQFKKSLNLLSHRGPDNSDFWIDKDNRVLIGHKRLSIIDLTNQGNQPMVSYSGNKVMVFNGCIYNYKEIKAEFKSINAISKSNSDTRILLELIDYFDLEFALKKIKGMYSIVIYDCLNRNIILVTDKFGEKPLYIQKNKNYFLFSSEIASINLFNKYKNDISKDALYDYFNKGYISGNKSIFKTINKVLPYSIIELEIKKIVNSQDDKYYLNKITNTKRYWIRKERTKKKTHINDDFENIKYLTNDYIKKTSVSDVNTGIFLSGGIDSSYILTKMSKYNDKKINTFNFSFKNNKFDSSTLSKNVANSFKSDHHIISINDFNIKYDIQLLPKIYSEPFADPSALPLYYLAKYSKDHIKVAYSGDGGDEIFSGYKRHYFWRFFLSIKNKKLLKILLTTIINKKSLKLFNILNSKFDNHYINANIETLQKVLFQQNISLENLYNMSISKDMKAAEEVLYFSKDREDEYEQYGITDLFIKEYEDYLNSNILVKSDRACMHNSIENRSPLLNADTVDFINHMNIDNYNKLIKNKTILKQLLKEEFTSYNMKKKSGFDIPLDDWIKNYFANDIMDLLNSTDTKNFLNGYLDVNKTIKMFNEYLIGKNDYIFFFWRLYILMNWYQYYKS